MTARKSRSEVLAGYPDAHGAVKNAAGVSTGWVVSETAYTYALSGELAHMASKAYAVILRQNRGSRTAVGLSYGDGMILRFEEVRLSGHTDKELRLEARTFAEHWLERDAEDASETDEERENPAGKADMPQAFTYADAERMYGVASHSTRRRVRDGDKVSLGANTTVRRDGEDIVVRLHATDIIRYHPDDSVTLNSGGHRTTTTKGRINAFLSPYISVRQHKHTWRVAVSAFVTDFYDGIRLYREGEPFGHRR